LARTYTSTPVHMSEDDCSSLDVESGSFILKRTTDHELVGVGMWTQSMESDHDNSEDIAVELCPLVDENVVKYSNTLGFEVDEEYCQDQSSSDLSTISSGGSSVLENGQWQTHISETHDSQISTQCSFKGCDISIDTAVELE
jgi:hypothetical protein